MERPRVPGWVGWVMRLLLAERDRRVLISELDELHDAWVAEHGRHEADRRYRRQLRQYPGRLLADRARDLARGAGAWNGVTSLRQALRSMARAPGITGAIVVTVGLGIAGCATVFAIIDALYLRPLAYADADRLGWIYTDHPPYQFPFSVADFQFLEERQSAFERVAAYRRSTGTLLGGDGEPERIFYLSPTPGLFEVLGIAPLAGRLPSSGEGAPAAGGTVLVTLGFADRRLGATRPDGSDRLGATVDLDGLPYSVVGVLPDDLGPLVEEAEVFPTLRLEPPPRRGPFFLRVVGRLRGGVAADMAADELRSLNRAILPVWIDTYREERSTWGMRSVPEVLQGRSGRLIGLLMGAVLALLVVAVVNAVGLLLARVAARRQELAVRTALGASGGHIAGHLLLESSILAFAGVALGLCVAASVFEVLPQLAGDYIPRLEEARLSGPTLGFAALLALGSGLLFAVVPALARQGRTGANALCGVARSGRGRREQRGQRILVAGQFAVTLPLLAAAGLLVSSFARLQRVEPGFRAEGLLTMRVSISRARHPEWGARAALWQRLEEEVASLPGVTAAGLASARPPATSENTNNFDLEDDPTPPGENQPLANWVNADSGYLEALGVPLLAGRLFRPDDLTSGESVAVVDEAWARRWFPDGDAVGRRMHEGGSPQWTTVIGVVGEVPYRGTGVETGGTVYQPYLPLVDDPYLTVRTAGDPAALARPIADVLRALDPTAPVTGVRTGQDLMRESLAQHRHVALVLGAFAVVALLLAVVGLYGVTAQRVQRRRGEIAVRLALGGRTGSVLRRILRESLALAGVGVAAGLLITVPVSGALRGLLYEVAPLDPATLVAAVGLLGAVATFATLVPAARVLAVDPASTLRDE